METNFFDYHIKTLEQKYPSFVGCQDYHLFTLLCIKYFYYSEAEIPFDQDLVLEVLTDGPNDGGIDAIFNDPTSENNDIIVVQSKYYNNSPLDTTSIAGELFKIEDTLTKLKNNKISDFNDKLVTAYRNATSQMEDNGEIKVVFFTSYMPKDKRERSKLEKSLHAFFVKHELELYFKNDIEAQIEMCDNGKATVDYDKIAIDKAYNYLSYEDSVIINISAISLQELYQRRRNGLLGMNLRYYVKQKTVDTGIEKTVKREPENFWYKNNGIVIVCDDFEIDGKEIKLWDFSIVNGGQTTNRIGKLDIEEDFYLQCKVVKSKGNDQREKDTFALEIAEATNSQKPIKKADLKANTYEQIKLKEALSHYGVYYITKKGDKAPRQNSEAYQIASLEQVGKIGLAAVLQMPGSARSNSQRMYADEYYPYIFKEENAGILADTLKIGVYYDTFVKTMGKANGFDEKYDLPMMKNGRTFQLACIGLLCKLKNEAFSYDTIKGHFNNPDVLKSILKNNGNMKKLINSSFDEERDIFYSIFRTIVVEVLGYCYMNAVMEAEEEQKNIAASDYLKLDNNYYRYVIKRLWFIYNNNSTFKANVDRICGCQV